MGGISLPHRFADVGLNVVIVTDNQCEVLYTMSIDTTVDVME